MSYQDEDYKRAMGIEDKCCKSCNRKISDRDYKVYGYCYDCYTEKKKNGENVDINVNQASFVLILISFCIPIVGAIVYGANVGTRREYANSCGVAGLIGFIIGTIIIYSVYFG